MKIILFYIFSRLYQFYLFFLSKSSFFTFVPPPKKIKRMSENEPRGSSPHHISREPCSVKLSGHLHVFTFLIDPSGYQRPGFCKRVLTKSSNQSWVSPALRSPEKTKHMIMILLHICLATRTAPPNCSSELPDSKETDACVVWILSPTSTQRKHESTSSLYKRETLSPPIYREGVFLPLYNEWRVSLFYTERRQTPSL